MLPTRQPKTRLADRGRYPTPVLERLRAAYVEDEETGCWVWQLSTNGRGYGRLWIGSRVDGTRRHVNAHRFAYELMVGPVPDGLHLDHLCRNRSCINPDHLEPVTQRENVLRGDAPAAHQARQVECKAGHPLSGDNLYVNKGKRYCRECNKRRSAEYRRRKSALEDYTQTTPPAQALEGRAGGVAGGWSG